MPRPPIANGGGNRPGIGGNRPDGGNRPTTLPGDLGDSGNRPNRPGIGGNRPDGGNRPTTLPGDLGGAGNRPNRPDWNDGRPGIGGNRPDYGHGGIWNSGNSLNNINTNINNNSFTNIGVNPGGWGYGNRPGWGYGGGYGGGWGYPGFGGHGGWCNTWNNGFVNPNYGGWYNGCWTGNWGFGSLWAPLAIGATTWGLASSLSNWGLGYGSLGYPGGSYVNPYYSAIPAAVMESSPYDYSQPVVVDSYAATEPVESSAAPQPPPSSPSNSLVDAALANFKAGNFVSALDSLDQAVKASPNDSVIHEVRALTLFALGRYPEAAATLNSVLASAPGMDWTTLSNLYGSVDTYTGQLRRLEDFCRGHSDDPAAHFVLAYHYLVAGHPEEAAEALEVVVAQQPDDLVSRQMLESIRPPEAATPSNTSTAPAKPATPAAPASGSADSPAPETDLVGTWKAAGDKESVELSITADSTFTWKATAAGRPPVELTGAIETASDAIKLDSEQAGTMVGNVASKGPDAFEFSLPGAPADVKPLAFSRQKP